MVGFVQGVESKKMLSRCNYSCDRVDYSGLIANP